MWAKANCACKHTPLKKSPLSRKHTVQHHTHMFSCRCKHTLRSTQTDTIKINTNTDIHTSIKHMFTQVAVFVKNIISLILLHTHVHTYCTHSVAYMQRKALQLWEVTNITLAYTQDHIHTVLYRELCINTVCAHKARDKNTYTYTSADVQSHILQ